MVSREKKIAAAALLLLLAQDEDIGSLLQGVEAPSPRPRHRLRRHQLHHAPSRVAREAEPSSVQFVYEEDDADSLAVEVGEPLDQHLPNSSQTAENTNKNPRPEKEDMATTQTNRPHKEHMAAIQTNSPHAEDDLGNLVQVEKEPVPFYVPPPSKKRKSKKSYRSETEVIEEAGGSTPEGTATDQEKKRKRFWSQRMYLQRDCPPDHPLSEGIPYLDPTEDLRVLRMSEECFEELLKLVSPLIAKKSTLMREAISPRQRLVAVLRYLVTGQSMETLKFSTLLSPSGMNTVLPETCQAIIQVLTPEYMKFPEKKEDWLKIASEFSESCDFPNCGGSLNARHICIFKRVGTNHHVNHKGYASVVLATLVDANHRFLSAEVISDERESDESAVLMTEFYQKLYQDSLDLPDDTENEGGLDFVFAAPNSFPVHERLLMPYPVVQLDVHAKITYNDKVRTVNRYSDNALGLMASRFGIFRTNINSRLWKVELIVRACCAIHNFLSVEGKDEYISDDTYDHRDEAGNMILGEWRREDMDATYSPLETVSRGPSPETGANREQYVEYFCAKLVERNLNLLL